MSTTVHRYSADDAARRNAENRREASVTIHLTAPTGGRIGPVLDELLPILNEIVGVLATDGVKVELVPVAGYHDTFYGHESILDDDPAT
jgi:hypothetical protein